MATYDRPQTLPTWCADNDANVAQPPDSLRATGYVPNEVPVAQFENWLRRSVGQWIGYLDQAQGAQVMATSLDFSLRLVGGGEWSYVAATQVLAWNDTAYLAVPGAPNSDNTLSAGNAVLGDGQIGWVQANIPFTTPGATTAGSTQVTGIAMPSALAVGQAVSGAGVPAGTTVQAIDGGTVTLSAAATATQAAAALTFAGSGPLQLQVASVASFTPGPNTVVLALGQGSSVLLGANSGQMLLRDGESKRLLGTGYVSVYRGVAGQALAARQPCYLSAGYNDGGRTAQALYPCDASSAGNRRAQFFGFTASPADAGATAMLVTSGVLNGFSGLTPGLVYYLDPANVGGITSTAPTGAGNYAVPVGLALSNTQLRLNPAGGQQLTPIAWDQAVKGNLTVAGNSTVAGSSTAASYVSAGGFKSVVPFGTFYHTQTTTTDAWYTYTTFVDVQTGNVARGVFRLPMTHAGSVLGISAWSSGAAGGKATAQVFKNDVAFLDGNQVGIFTPQFPVASGQKATYAYAKGVMPFAAGDSLTVKLVFDTAGVQNLQVALTLELNAA